MEKEEIITRKILSAIRESKVGEGAELKMIKEEKDNGVKSFSITKKTPQFGDVRVSQEEALTKTIGESIDFEEDALIFYPSKKVLALTGKINALNIVFQFRYNDESGEGCYIWANRLQLTDTNSRTIGKIRDAFTNWRNNLVNNGDLIEKLQKASSR